MNSHSRYIIRAPNGDQIAECELFLTNDTEGRAVFVLEVSESYPLPDEVGDFTSERIA